jgi:hypothetical protein
MTALDLDAVKARASRAWGWVKEDECVNGAGNLPLSTRTHFDQDMPALLAELAQARAQLAAHREFAAQVDVYAIHDELTQANVEALHERLTEACDLATELQGEGQWPPPRMSCPVSMTACRSRPPTVECWTCSTPTAGGVPSRA